MKKFKNKEYKEAFEVLSLLCEMASVIGMRLVLEPIKKAKKNAKS